MLVYSSVQFLLCGCMFVTSKHFSAGPRANAQMTVHPVRGDNSSDHAFAGLDARLGWSDPILLMPPPPMPIIRDLRLSERHSLTSYVVYMYMLSAASNKRTPRRLFVRESRTHCTELLFVAAGTYLYVQYSTIKKYSVNSEAWSALKRRTLKTNFIEALPHFPLEFTFIVKGVSHLGYLGVWKCRAELLELNIYILTWNITRWRKCTCTSMKKYFYNL